MGEWGSNSEIYIAIFTALLFAATVALAAIAWQQIGSARDENRETQTLLACGRYDTDPIIFACHKKLVETKHYLLRNDRELLENALQLRLEIITILNFLDAIAIGVKQELYVEELAKAHISPIVRRHVSELIDSGVLEKLDCPRSCFQTLIDLDKEWQ